MSAAAAALSLLGPVVVGWLLTQRMWPDVPGGLRLGLGASLGAGVAGTVYFFALLVSDSARASLAMSEIFLVGAIVVLLLRRRRVQRGIESEASSNRAYAWCAAITAIVAGAAFLFVLDLSRRGGFDALVMWNLRARLIAASKVSPLSSILDKALLGLHLDYPLLLPSLVSRGWQYVRSDSSIVPAAIAALFTIATIVISVGGIRVLRTDSQGWIAASILLGTPLLLGQGASQYADIVMCCFITAAVTLFCVYDFDPARSGLPVLAGIAAAAAACTKNEGILFLVVLSAARLTAVVLRRSIPGAWRELVGFSGGAFFGVLTLAVFKLWYSPPNEISALSVQAVWTRLTDANLNFEIVRGIRDSLNFGQWRLNPMPWMALHAAVTWSPAAPPNSKKVASWFTAAFVITGMLCGFHIVYLVSPYDTEYYVQSSFNRLMLQLWPCAIIFYSLMAAPRSALSRAAAFRAVGVLIVIASIVAWSQMDRQLRVVAGSKPRIELSKTEVTAGDSYVIKITGIAGPEVYITYSLDGKPMGQFNAYLGRDGSVKFPVSQSTPKGVYRFLAVRTSDNPVWTPFANDAAIVKK